MTMKRHRTMIALLTALALTPACGGQEPTPVDTIAYLPDGSLVAFMPTGIHVFGDSLDRETRTILFDGLPVAMWVDANRYSLSADGRVAAVSFPAPSLSMERSTIALFDMTTGARLKTLRPDDASPDGRAQGVYDLELSPHGDLVFSRSIDGTSNGDVYHSTMFDTATGAPLWTGDAQWRMPVFSQDGSLLIVENLMPLRLEALDARTGAIVYTVDLPGYVYNLAVTSDGLAGMVGPPPDMGCPEPGSCPPSYAVWSPADGALLAEWPGVPETNSHGTNPAGLAAFWCSSWDSLCATDIIDFSNHEQQPAVLNFWRTDGTPVRTLAKAYADTAINVVAFSPDSQFIATAPLIGAPAPVQVFRIADGKLMGTLSFH